MQPREHRGEELASLREECDRAWAIVDRQSAELAAARSENLSSERDYWQRMADMYGAALLKLGLHSAGQHQAPNEYDMESWRQCDRQACVDEAVEGINAALAASIPYPEDGAAREFSALVDEARANHVRWEHTAELLEECLRPLCIGAKVLLWPDPDAPRSSALAEPREADA